MKKKNKYSKENNNQASFFFEDYLETTKINKFSKKNNLFQDRIYLLFFLFFSLILIFSIRITHVSLDKIKIFEQENILKSFSLNRRDIVDRNGVLISRNIKAFHAAINPSLISNKQNFLIKLRINFPDLPIDEIERKINKGKYFYLKKRITQNEKKNYGAWEIKASFLNLFNREFILMQTYLAT